jgi:hypothetical protein
MDYSICVTEEVTDISNLVLSRFLYVCITPSVTFIEISKEHLQHLSTCSLSPLARLAWLLKLLVLSEFISFPMKQSQWCSLRAFASESQNLKVMEKTSLQCLRMNKRTIEHGRLISSLLDTSASSCRGRFELYVAHGRFRLMQIQGYITEGCMGLLKHNCLPESFQSVAVFFQRDLLHDHSYRSRILFFNHMKWSRWSDPTTLLVPLNRDQWI